MRVDLKLNLKRNLSTSNSKGKVTTLLLLEHCELFPSGFCMKQGKQK